MLNRRSVLKSGALALGAAALDLDALAAGPVARTAQHGWLELDRNENPHGPSGAAKRAMIVAIGRGSRYLDSDEINAFRDQLALREGVRRESIVLGAGSSEILWMAAAEFLRANDVLVASDPTFELIGRCAERLGANVERVPVSDKQMDDLPALEAALAKKPKLVYLCNPNNPCGTMVAPGELRAFVSRAARQAPVLVDEAYLEYADPALTTSTSLLAARGETVIVARTFSKIFGLAGLRMGYAIAPPEIASRLSRHRFSVLNSLAVAAASASVSDKAFIETARKKNAEGRAIITRALDRAGMRHVPSSTNFVWFDQSRRPDLPVRLREKKILIPHNRFGGGWNRVTIGTVDEAEAFASALG